MKLLGSIETVHLVSLEIHISPQNPIKPRYGYKAPEFAAFHDIDKSHESKFLEVFRLNALCRF